MSTAKSNTLAIKTAAKLDENLQYLKLPFIKCHPRSKADPPARIRMTHPKVA